MHRLLHILIFLLCSPCIKDIRVAGAMRRGLKIKSDEGTITLGAKGDVQIRRGPGGFLVVPEKLKIGKKTFDEAVMKTLSVPNKDQIEKFCTKEIKSHIAKCNAGWTGHFCHQKCPHKLKPGQYYSGNMGSHSCHVSRCTNAKIGEYYTGSGSDSQTSCPTAPCTNKPKAGFHFITNGGSSSTGCKVSGCTNAKIGEYYIDSGSNSQTSCPTAPCTNKPKGGFRFITNGGMSSTGCKIGGHKWCNAGEWTKTPGNDNTDTVCAPCSKGRFRAKKATNNDKGEKETSVCIAHKTCEAGEWTEAEGDAKTDTKCTPCNKRYFRTTAPKGKTKERETNACSLHKTCEAGEWTEAEGTAKTDTKCTPCNKDFFRSAAPKGNTKERETDVCLPHGRCEGGEWTKAAGTRTKDTTCAKCPSGTARPKAPANSRTVEKASACGACIAKSLYSDEEGLTQCKQCPSGSFGVVVAGSKAEGGHKACDDNTCERPTSLPENSVVVASKCPDHGKHKQTCTLSCKTGFYSTGSSTTLTCAPDGKATTASYQGGKFTCADVDECRKKNGGCHSKRKCINTLGSVECGDCPAGYANDGAKGCKDINECLKKNGGCHSKRKCTNTVGSMKCGDCSAGYTNVGAKGCKDINECLKKNGGCHNKRKCINMAGSMKCGNCAAGYANVGAKGCKDINECLKKNGGCHNKRKCTNTAGSMKCGNCAAGYVNDGAKGCKEHNECLKKNGGCHSKRKCINTVGSMKCGNCPAGYANDGAKGCKDINECLKNSGGCHSKRKCTNMAGSMKCGNCAAGYVNDGAKGCKGFPVLKGTAAIPISWIKASGKNRLGTLLYRATLNGFSQSTWHRQVDNRGTTLTVMRDSKGNIFGGYTAHNWRHAARYGRDTSAWLFWLKCYAKLPPGQSRVFKPQYSIYAHNSYGPTFGGGHDIYVPANMRSVSINWGHSYRIPSGQKNTFVTGKTSGNTLTEVEVYQVV